MNAARAAGPIVPSPISLGLANFTTRSSAEALVLNAPHASAGIASPRAAQAKYDGVLRRKDSFREVVIVFSTLSFGATASASARNACLTILTDISLFDPARFSAPSRQESIRRESIGDPEWRRTLTSSSSVARQILNVLCKVRMVTRAQPPGFSFHFP